MAALAAGTGTQGGAYDTTVRGPDSPGDRPHAVGAVERGFALVAMAEAEALRDEAESPSLGRGTGRRNPIRDGVHRPTDTEFSSDLQSYDWRALLGAYPWNVEEALLVIYGPTPLCPNGESGGNASAYNANNYGLFQIASIHVEKLYRVTGSRDLSLLFDPAVNVAVAYIIWADQGWAPWACRPGR